MAIFGLARSGLAALNYLALKTDHECFAVNQGAPSSWESYALVKKLIPEENCFDEEDALELFAEADVIIKSPGIPYGHKALAKAQANRVEIISEIEFAFRHSDIPVLAVTGTNGKTTTATMISDLLSKLGKKVFLGGNIGIPYSNLLMEEEVYDYAVIEVSSFQLENIKSFRPQIAVLTNISPSHGERYDSHELYRDAKLKLFQNMGSEDLAVVPKSLFDLNLPCSKVPIAPLEGFDFSQSKMAGVHNRENAFCAYECAKKVFESDPEGASRIDEELQRYINDYKSVSFRIEFIRTVEGLEIYNDGKSTNMASTLAALDSFPGKKVSLILGGKLRDRDMDFSELLRRDVAGVYAFGEARDFIEENLGANLKLEKFETLEEVFEKIEADRPKGVLLFSPAFPSFDLYRNYEERALAFNSLVKSLGLGSLG